MAQDGALEAAFMNAAQRAGGVDPLLKAFFGFLHRRTDFYCVIPDDMPSAKLGFRENVAEQMVLNAFHSFPMKNLDGSLRTPAASHPAPAAPKTSANPPAPRNANLPATPASTSTPAASTSTSATPASTSASATRASTSASKPARSGKEEIETLASRLRVSEDGKQIPLPGNGGVTDRYHWSQSLEEITIHLDAGPVVAAKQIDCKLLQKSLRVARKDTGEVLLEGEYPAPERIKPDESFWSLERDGASSTLVISLTKSRETWWDAILQGEPEIDTTQVDSTRRIEEYDESTQATIRKVMFDQRQKAQGLPTSDELAKDALLDEASKLPGSPFSE